VLLRASGLHGGSDYELGNILGRGLTESRIADAGILVEFADAYFADAQRFAVARARLVETMGPGALVDAAGVLAIFDAVVRIADATGIPLEPYKEELSRDLRGPLGIDDFPAAGGAGPDTQAPS
jgi:hypothetical protein